MPHAGALRQRASSIDLHASTPVALLEQADAAATMPAPTSTESQAAAVFLPTILFAIHGSQVRAQIPDEIDWWQLDSSGGNTVVTFESEPLDRDFVLLVSGAASGDSVTVSGHKRPGEDGALDMIYPGERIDEKVALSFARATAARITDVSVTFEGVFLGDIAPNPPRDLTDGEPWTLFGTFDEPGVGCAIIRGKRAGEAFALEVPIWLPDEASTPFVERLWAKERIKELERADLTGRRADAMKARIVELCVKHGIASKYAAFIVIEKRKGERWTSEQAETQVVPVNVPAGWSMFQPGARHVGGKSGPGSIPLSNAMIGAPFRPPSQSAPMPPMQSSPYAPPRRAMGSGSNAGFGRPAPMPAFAPAAAMDARTFAASQGRVSPAPEGPSAIFQTQGATGLWGDERDIDSACAATVKTLEALFAEKIDAVHSVYDAQIRKAIDALVKCAPRLAKSALRVRLFVVC